MKLAEQLRLLVRAHLFELGRQGLGFLWQQRLHRDRRAELLAHALDGGNTVTQHSRQILRIEVDGLDAAAQALLEVVERCVSHHLGVRLDGAPKAVQVIGLGHGTSVVLQLGLQLVEVRGLLVDRLAQHLLGCHLLLAQLVELGGGRRALHLLAPGRPHVVTGRYPAGNLRADLAQSPIPPSFGTQLGHFRFLL
ncbi:hypothetical protein D3C77_514180 [compost metagenome]